MIKLRIRLNYFIEKQLFGEEKQQFEIKCKIFTKNGEFEKLAIIVTAFCAISYANIVELYPSLRIKCKDWLKKRKIVKVRADTIAVVVFIDFFLLLSKWWLKIRDEAANKSALKLPGLIGNPSPVQTRPSCSGAVISNWNQENKERIECLQLFQAQISLNMIKITYLK